MIYRREIDGLRAIAVISVILYHAGLYSFTGGFVGVDIFFVISGYLITSIIVNELEAGTFSITQFYERRARRILPALFFIIACSLPFAWNWMMPEDLHEVAKSLMGVSTFASNIYFYWGAGDYFNNDAELKPLLHTWSLAVEEQFYFVFPLFLSLTWRFGRKQTSYVLAAVSLVSLILAEWGAYNRPDAAFYLLPARAWELGIGGLIALYLQNRERFSLEQKRQEVFSAVGLLLITISVFCFGKTTPFPGLYALIPTIGTGLIIICSGPSTMVGRLLGSRILVGIGLISYSGYLWHQVLFSLARHRSLTDLGSTVMVCLSLLSLALAACSWRFVEQPFRSRTKFSRRQIFQLATFGSVVAFSIGLAGHLAKGFPSRIQADTPRRIAQVIPQKDEQQECWERLKDKPVVDNVCTVGAEKVTPSFSIIGDSHGGALVTAIDNAATSQGLSGLNLTLSGCPVLLEAERLDKREFRKACIPFKKDLLRRLKEKTLPQTIILGLRWTIWIELERFNNGEGGIESGENIQLNHSHNLETTGYMKNDYARKVRTLLDLGYKVIVVYPIPEMGWHVPRYLTRSYLINGRLREEDGSTDYGLFVTRNAHARAALDSIGDHPNLIRVYPEKHLCNTLLPGRCLAHLDGQPLYFDDDHPSVFAATSLVAEILPHLLPR